MPIKRKKLYPCYPIAVTRTTVTEIATGQQSYKETTVNYPTAFGESWTTVSNNTPGYWSILRAGGALPDNFFDVELDKRPTGSVETSKFVRDLTHATLIHRSYPIEFYTGVGPLPWVLTDFGVKVKLLARAKGNQWSTPVFLAEARKSVDMVVDRATKLVQLMRMLRRGNIAQFLSTLRLTNGKAPSRRDPRVRRFNRDFGRDALNTASRTWLEYSYGWVPLMMDVRNAVNTLMDTAERSPARVMRVTATDKKVYTWSNSRVTVEVAPPMTASERIEVIESYRGVWRYEIKPEDIPGRFGLTNPLEVAWELVPFSFVADWFLPIGDYLSSLDASIRFSYVSGSIGSRQEVIRTLSDFQSTYWDSVGYADNQSRMVKVKRRALSGTPAPELKSIRFQFGIDSLRRLASATALLRVNASRFRV